MLIDFLDDVTRSLVHDMVLSNYAYTESELKRAIAKNVELYRLLSAKNLELRKKLREVQRANG